MGVSQCQVTKKMWLTLLQWQCTAQEALAHIYPTDLWTKLLLVLAVWAGMHNSTVLMPVLESEMSIQLTPAQQHRAAHGISSLTEGLRCCFRQEQTLAMLATGMWVLPHIKAKQ